MLLAAATLLLGLGAAVAAPQAAATAAPSFIIRNDAFVKDGEPFILRSGSLHYFRVPPGTSTLPRFSPLLDTGNNSIQHLASDMALRGLGWTQNTGQIGCGG